MKGKHRLMGAGLVTALLSCPVAWTQPPDMAGGPPQATDTGGATGQALRADISCQINETITLRHSTGLPLKEILVSREGVIGDIVKVQPDDASLWKATGKTVGVTQVTLVTTDGQSEIKLIRVDPDLNYIRSLLAKNFPTANLTLIPGGQQGSLIVGGWLESPEDVQPILTYLRGFVPGNNPNFITNAMRVSGVQQVKLEVCVARVQRTDFRNMGFSFFRIDQEKALLSSIGGTPLSLQEGILRPPGVLATNPSSVIQFVLTEPNSAFVGFLQALKQEGVGKILAQPSITTMSGREAAFLVGGEVPAVVAGGGASGGQGGVGGGGGAIQFRPFGTRVSFLPVVLGDGRIRLQVQAEVSQVAGTVTQAFFTAPSFVISQVQSTIEMENKQSFILGGLLQTELNGTTSKLPVLGELPFVGAAFRSVELREIETELVVMVTVSLVDALDSHQKPCMLPGQETRKATDFELFLEGIMEAPRGPRELFPNNKYVPAHKLAPPYGVPMGDGCNGNGWGSSCGKVGCTTGCTSCTPCGSAPVQTAPAPMPAPQQSVSRAAAKDEPLMTPMVKDVKPMPMNRAETKPMPVRQPEVKPPVMPASSEATVIVEAPKAPVVPAAAPPAPTAPSLPPLPADAKREGSSTSEVPPLPEIPK